MLIAALGASRTGIESTNEATAEESTSYARFLADACAEEAILRLRANLSYAGNESIVVNMGDSCTIGNISGLGATNRVIHTDATVLGYVRHVELTIATVTPILVVSTWNVVP
jgi:hypothetical protein